MARDACARYRPAAWLILVLVAAVASIASDCPGKQTNPDTLTPTISVTPAGPIGLPIGQNVQLTVLLTNAGTATTTFTSSSPSVASVDANTGLVRCLAAGPAIITARAVGTNNGVAINLAQGVTITCSGTIGPTASG